jgi:L,D-transpeptidase ErfK/SrfK
LSKRSTAGTRPSAGGEWIAVPRNIDPGPVAYSPFPVRKAWTGGRHLVVDLNVLAWGAYDNAGGNEAVLVRWGPANGGSKICSDTHMNRCKSPVGERRILRLYGRWKKSDLYPLDCADKGKCGARMPWYMKLVHSGEGPHGYAQLPGWNASHGCLRVTVDDARWINKEFASKGMLVVLADY